MIQKANPGALESYSSKKTVGLTVRRDLLAIAREYGVNLSKLLENSLIELLESQAIPISRETPFLTECSFGKENSWRARRELNPRPPDFSAALYLKSPVL